MLTRTEQPEDCDDQDKWCSRIRKLAWGNTATRTAGGTEEANVIGTREEGQGDRVESERTLDVPNRDEYVIVAKSWQIWLVLMEFTYAPS